MLTRLARGLAALVLAAAAALLMATPALAHTSLHSSDPAKGATLTAPPTSVTLTFAEAVTVGAQPIRVTGPGGVAWKVGPVSVTGATVSAPVTATGPAGACTIAWSVIADDGDTVTGTVPFTIAAAPAPVTSAAAPATTAATTAPATSAPAAAAPPSATVTSVPVAQTGEQSGGGIPFWVWIVVAAVVLAVGGVVVARRA